MSGRLMVMAIVGAAIIAGISMFYLQIYGFYDQVEATGETDVQLTNMVTGMPEPILFSNFQAIDSESSPIRYRACFDTSMSIPMLSETYESYEGGAPRVAPGWFSCFDAKQIGAEIESGKALVFTGHRNIEFGIDRVVAITDDGRGYVWHEINECGDKAYDGSPLGEDCPPKDGET